MARYELGAVYRITDEANGVTYYVRLLENNNYGAFAPFEGELCEETLSRTPYRLYLSCNTFPVKRAIWEKVLPSPGKTNRVHWQEPDLANFANFDPASFIRQSKIFHKGNLYYCEKEKFIHLVKSGLIKNIFNTHEFIPAFLRDYYDGWPHSYITDEVYIYNGTSERQKEHINALHELGIDITKLLQEKTV